MVRIPLLARLVSCFTLTTFIAFADTLILPNGEHISGTVIEEEGGVVEFKTTYLGTVKAKTTEVKVVKDITPVVGDVPMPIPHPPTTQKAAQEAKAPSTEAAVDEPKVVPIWKRWKKPNNWSGKATVGISEKRGEKNTTDHT